MRATWFIGKFKLDLNCTRINTRGAVEIAKSLQLNTSLQELDLSNNCIRQEGEAEIANILENNYCITDIKFGILDKTAQDTLYKIIDRNKMIYNKKRFV